MSVSKENGCQLLLIHALKAVGRPMPDLRICELGDQMIRARKKYIAPLKLYLEFFGVEHLSIDLNGRHGAVKYDLRKPLPEELFDRFDLVTNFGTTEHIDEQLPVFRNIHNLCRMGGLMVHALPVHAPDHGLWGYVPDWFSELAWGQGYTVVHLQRYAANELQEADPLSGYSMAILRKESNSEFNRGRFQYPERL